jgi:hypothetical protein
MTLGFVRHGEWALGRRISKDSTKQLYISACTISTGTGVIPAVIRALHRALTM